MAPKSTSLNKFETTKELLEKEVSEVSNGNNLVQNNPSISNTQDLSPTSRLRQKMSTKVVIHESKLKKEMSTYENLPACDSSVEVLNWWRNHKTMLPLLSKLARKYLGIPATSTQSERVFSAGGRVCSSSRTSLETGKVESLLLLLTRIKKLPKEYIQIRK